MCRIENWELRTENWELRTENWELRTMITSAAVANSSLFTLHSSLFSLHSFLLKTLQSYEIYPCTPSFFRFVSNYFLGFILKIPCKCLIDNLLQGNQFRDFCDFLRPFVSKRAELKGRFFCVTKNLWNLWNLCDNKMDVKHFQSLPWPLISPVFRPFQPPWLSLRETPTFPKWNTHFSLTKLSVPPRLSRRSDLTHSLCKDFFFSTCVHGVTQLRSYAVSFAVGDVSFSNGYLYYIIIYNILYIII